MSTPEPREPAMNQHWTEELADAFHRLADTDIKVHLQSGVVVANTYLDNARTGWQVQTSAVSFPTTKSSAQVVRDVQTALDNQFAGTR